MSTTRGSAKKAGLKKKRDAMEQDLASRTTTRSDLKKQEKVEQELAALPGSGTNPSTPARLVGGELQNQPVPRSSPVRIAVASSTATTLDMNEKDENQQSQGPSTDTRHGIDEWTTMVFRVVKPAQEFYRSTAPALEDNDDGEETDQQPSPQPQTFCCYLAAAMHGQGLSPDSDKQQDGPALDVLTPPYAKSSTFSTPPALVEPTSNNRSRPAASVSSPWLDGTDSPGSPGKSQNLLAHTLDSVGEASATFAPTPREPTNHYRSVLFRFIHALALIIIITVLYASGCGWTPDLIGPNLQSYVNSLKDPRRTLENVTRSFLSGPFKAGHVSEPVDDTINATNTFYDLLGIVLPLAQE